jgi:DNA-binding MarR family transcriptional regulator
MVLTTIVSSDYGMAPTDVAWALAARSRTSARIVLRLVKLGWLTRIRHPRDARIRVLRLTEHGKLAHERAAKAVTAAAHELLIALDHRKKDDLITMSQMITAMNRPLSSSL